MRVPTAVLGAVTALGVCAAGQVQTGNPWDRESEEQVTYFSGKVTLPDGGPPPDLVRLTRVCAGLSRDEGWTDAKGHFWFKVSKVDSGTESGDASEPAGQPQSKDKPLGYAYSNPITTALANCELRVLLEGYQAEAVSLKVASVGATNLGAIVLHPLAGISTLTVSSTTLQAPPKARGAYEKGLEAMRERKWDFAEAELNKAVKIYPGFAVAWYQLGKVRLGRGDPGGAAAAWRESTERDPRFVKPWEDLTRLADGRQDWTESERSSSAWLKLDAASFPAAWLYNAIARARLGRLDEAEASAREGLKVDKEQRVPRLSYVLALILLAKHKYTESAEWFRDYLKRAPDAREAEAIRQELTALQTLPASSP